MYTNCAMIATYAGEGAIWNGPSYPRLISQDILRGALREVSHFIMPGGRDLLYHTALQGEPNTRLRQFVEEGGTYIGICAGAYYGCRQVEFDKGFPLEVCGFRELGFFSGKAIGPAFGKGTYTYNSEEGAKIVALETINGPLYSYYNGGCFFEGDFSNTRILARFADLPNKPPAILECSINKGKAILSGVHLELYLSEVSQNLSSDEMKMEMKDRLARIGAIIR